jgi:uncharacterized repeat protein (TIGR01451 family)
MKKLLLLLLFSGLTHAQIVNIPDANLKAALLSANPSNYIANGLTGSPTAIDTNANSEIEVSEALQISSITVRNAGIADLTGLEAFTNLATVVFEDNQISSLAPLYGLTSVYNLDCSANQIASLPVGFMAGKLDVDLADNLLTTLDMSQANLLMWLDVSGNQIASLDFSDVTTDFIGLYFSDTMISDIDESLLSSLYYIQCDNTPVTSLDVGGMTNLSQLSAKNTMITSFMAADKALLEYVDFSDSALLTSAVVTNCPVLWAATFVNSPVLQSVDLSDNPSLNDMFGLDAVPALETVDLSGCTGLQGFAMFNNDPIQISSIDITGCINAAYFICRSAQLTSVDLTAFPQMNTVDLRNNPLTSVNLSGLTNLASLDLGNTGRTTLDVSGFPNLTSLWVDANQLTILDVSACTNLGTLSCENNLLATLDVTACTSLAMLHCTGNPMESLFMKNGSNEEFNVFTGLMNNTLEYVCADNSQIADVLLKVQPTTVVNSYCSFIPGGPYNTISGTVTTDSDANGCDALDPKFPYIKMVLSGAADNTVFTADDGNYAFYTADGTFAVAPQLENPTFFTIAPPNATVNFPLVDNSVSVNDFCIAANGIHPDVEVVVAPIGRAMPGFAATYSVVCRNKGNQTLSGIVALAFDDNVIDFTSASVSPDIQSAGNLEWNYANLQPLESRRITVYFDLNSQIDTPPLNIGDQLIYSATINPVAGDENANDNTYVLRQPISGSYDPNNKQCLEGDVISPEKIGAFLHYVINFENTGTAEALNVVIKDTLDITKFDVNSLQVLDSSHPVSIRMNGNVVEFIFSNINLEIGGHGNILLKIKTRDDLLEGDIVSNRADVYFDYNHPIDTGFANTVFQTLGVGEHTDQSVAIWPNPVDDVINIAAATAISSVQLYDVQGRLLQISGPGSALVSIPVASRQSGIYFVKVFTDNGITIQKIIKN